MTRLLAISGTYRDHGTIDQAVAKAVETARSAGAEVEVVNLRDYPIEFCKNCRECTQAPGEAPGPCVHHDAMATLVAKIESADAYILASPTNFYSVTAIFKRFMERLVVYAYWPWGAHAPTPRKKVRTKKALVIASAAAPSILARLFFATTRQLKETAKTIGADASSIFIGRASGTKNGLRATDVRRVERATLRLLRG